MAIKTRRVDAKSRVILPESFAGQLVTVEVTDAGGLQIRIAKVARRRPSFYDLVAGMSDTDLPEFVDFGPPVGKEWKE